MAQMPLQDCSGLCASAAGLVQRQDMQTEGAVGFYRTIARSPFERVKRVINTGDLVPASVALTENAHIAANPAQLQASKLPPCLTIWWQMRLLLQGW